MLRPLRHPFRSNASPEESAFPSDMETCVREYVPVCPPWAGLVLSVGKYAGYSLLLFMLEYLFLLFLCLVSFRFTLRLLIRLYRMSKKHTRFVVLVGSTADNLEIYHEMSGSEDTGYSVVGYF